MADDGDTGSDELVSQWMAFTGSVDSGAAKAYLEMSNGDLQTAVGLFLEHQGGGGGGGTGGTGSASGPGFGGDGVRAPDATRTMRLMDDGPMMGGGHQYPYAGMMYPMRE